LRFLKIYRQLFLLVAPSAQKPNYATEYVSLSILYACNDNITCGATQFWTVTIVDISKHKH